MDELDKLYQQYSNNGGQDTFEVFSDKVLFEPNYLEDLKKKDQTTPEVPSNSQPQTTALPISNDLELNQAQQEAISQAQSANSLASDTMENPSLPVSPATETVSSGLGNSNLINPTAVKQPDLSLPSQVSPVAPDFNIPNFTKTPPTKDPKKLLGVDTVIDNTITTQPEQQDIFQLQESEKLNSTDYQKPKDVKLEVITSGAFEGNNILGNAISKADELLQYQNWQSKGWGSILPDEKNGRPQFQVNDAGQKPIKELLGMRTPDAYDYQAATDKVMKPILQGAEIENQLRKEQEAVLGPDYFNEKGLLTRTEFEQAKQQKLTQDYINQGYTNEQAVAMTNQYLQKQTEAKNAQASQYINGIMQRAQYVNDLFDGKAEQNAAFTAREKMGWNQILTDYPQDFADYLKARGYDKFGEVGDYNFELESGKATGRRRILDDFFNWKKQNLIDYSSVLKNRDEQAKMDINKAIERKDATAIQQLREQRNNTTIAEINQETALFNKINQDEVNINKNFDVTEKLKMDAATEYAGYQSGKPLDVLSYSAKNIGTGIFKVAADVVSAPLALISPISKTTRQLNETLNNEIKNPFNVLQSGWDDKVKIYQDEKTGQQYEERFGFVYQKDANGNLTLDEKLSYNGTKGLKFIKEETDFNIASAAGTVVNMMGTMVTADGLAGFINGGTSSRLARWAGKSAEALGKENILTKSLYTAAEAAQSYNKASALSWSYVTARQNMETAQEAGLSPLQSFAYTVFQSAATGLMTRVHPDDIFFKEYSATNKNLFRLLSNNKIDEARLLATDFIKKYAKTATGENVQEFSEQIVQDLVNRGFNFINEKNKSGNDKFTTSDINDYFNIGEQTSSYTFLLNTFNALGRGRIRTNGMTNLEKAIVASQLPEAKQMLYDLSDQSLTGYTFEKANTMLAQINEVEKYTKQIPDGVQLNVSQTADVILKMQQAEKLKAKIKENGDSPANGVIQEQLDGINKEIDKTLKEGLQNANKTKIDLNAKTGDQLIQPITNEQNTQPTSQPETLQEQTNTNDNEPEQTAVPKAEPIAPIKPSGGAGATAESGVEENNVNTEPNGQITTKSQSTETTTPTTAVPDTPAGNGQGTENNITPTNNETQQTQTDQQPANQPEPATSTPDATSQTSGQETNATVQNQENAISPEQNNIDFLNNLVNGQTAQPTNDTPANAGTEPGTGGIQQTQQQGTEDTQAVPTTADSRGSESDAEIGKEYYYDGFKVKLVKKVDNYGNKYTIVNRNGQEISVNQDLLSEDQQPTKGLEYSQQLLNISDPNEKSYYEGVRKINGKDVVLVSYIFKDGNKLRQDTKYVDFDSFDSQYRVINNDKARLKIVKSLKELQQKSPLQLGGKSQDFINKENEIINNNSKPVQPTTTISDNEQSKATLTEEVIPTSNKNYSIIKKTNDRGASIFEFRNNKTGKIVTPSEKTRKKYLMEWMKSQTFPETEIPEGATNRDADDIIRKESNNPVELAIALLNTEKYLNDNGSKEYHIATTARRVSRDSFINASDKNNITIGLANAYFEKKDKVRQGSSIDSWAYDASESFAKDYGGDEITHQDIVDFMLQYKNGPEQYLHQINPDYQAARDRFYEITGLNPTDSVISELLGRNDTPQDLELKKRAEDYYEKLPLEQQDNLEKEYNDWFKSLSLEEQQAELIKSYPYEILTDEKGEIGEQSQPSDKERQSSTNANNKGGTESQSKKIATKKPTNSPEYQQLLKDREVQEARVKSTKESLDKVNKNTNRTFQADQENLFGERQSQEGLFDERADGSAGKEIIAKAKREYDQAKADLAKTNKAIRDFESGNASGTGAINFQSGNQRFTPLTKEAFQNLIDRLKKAFPKFAKVTTSWDEFFRKAKSGGYNVNFDANFQIENKNPLIVIHNISERGLANVMNIGGLPVPSLAITSANNTLSSFGEITLIGDPYLADPRQPANKVFDTDVYSPRYPRSQKSFKSISEQRKFEKEILDLANQNEKSDFIYLPIEDALNDMRSDQIMTAYMVDNNIPFPESKYGNGAREYFYNTDGAEQALQDWVAEKTEKYNIEDKIFNGYTPSGNRKYIPHNLENVVKLLKGKIKNGENFTYGAGNIRASASKQFKSIEEIKNDRNKIVSKKEIENLKSETENELSDLLESLKDNYRFDKNSFSYYDEAAASIGEFAGGKRNALSDTFENLSNEQINSVKDYILKLKNAPTEYFEAKPQRAVNLREFKAAVVPKGTSQKILDQLKQKGIIIYEYDSKVDGDRQQKVNQASSEQDVQFMHNAKGTVYGAKLPDGTIYINPQYLNANTPIHEFSHLWEQLLPKAWAKGLEIFKQTKTGKDLHAQLKQEGNYANLTDEQLWSEAMNTYIGNIGEERYQNPKGKMAQFMEWLRTTFAKLGEFLKFGGKLTPETQLKTFTEKVLGDLMGGKPVTVEAETQSNGSTQYSFLTENDFDSNGNIKPEVLAEIQAERERIKSNAIANGTFMKAPNGKDTNLNEAQWIDVRTKRFTDWFGDWQNDPENASKVVDDNGEPLVVYHGTKDNFNEFDLDKVGKNGLALGKAFYFTNSPEIANSFGDVKSFYLKLNGEISDKNKTISKADVIKIITELEKYDEYFLSNYGDIQTEGRKPVLENAIDDIYNYSDNDIDIINSLFNVGGVDREIVSKTIFDITGKNGIIVNADITAMNATENEIVYAVITPNQIKSATENLGTYSNKTGRIDFQIIGEQGARNLDAAEEATTRLDNLSIAREMESAGKTDKEIRLATGWERGADGKWRYEIIDGKLISKSKFAINKLKEFNWKYGTLEQLFSAHPEIKIEYDNYKDWTDGNIHKLGDIFSADELYNSYPELKDINVVYKIVASTITQGDIASYNPKTKTIEINVLDNAESIIIHEIQHAIQEIEGFARGGNENTASKFKILQLEAQAEKLNQEGMTIGNNLSNLNNEEWQTAVNKVKDLFAKRDKIYNEIEKFKTDRLPNYLAYKNLSGETEARNVQTRANMSIDERRATLLSETEDVAREDQIILMNSLGTANSLPTGKNLIPNSTINTVVDEIRNNGLDAGLRKLQESNWYKNLTPEQQNNITLDNYAAMLLDSAKANQSIKQEKEQNNKLNTEQATTQSRKKSKVTERIKPAIKTNVKSVKKLNQIIADAAKSLQTTLIYGKALSRNAAGTYNPTNTLVRIKNAGDLDTVAHELGHFIDDKFDFLGNLKKSNQISIEKEIKWFYERGGSNPPTGLSKEQKQNYLYREGLAEFVRAYIVNPEAAQSIAPSLYAEFESVLDEKALQSIKDFSNDVINFSNASYADKISSNVQESSLKDKESFLKWKKEADGFGFRIWDNINANIFDSMAKANKAFLFINKLKGDPKLLPEKDFKLLHRIFAGVNGKIDKILMNGMVDGKNRPVLSSDGERMNMKWLLGSFDTTSPETVKADMDETIRLLIAERTIEYAKKFGRLDDLSGIGGGLQSDFEVAQGYMSDFEQLKTGNREKYDRIKESAARYREFADAGLRYAVEKGRLSWEDYKKIKESNEYYVNMTRVRETVPTEEDEAFFGAGGNLTSSKDVFKKSKGGTDMIGNPYESLLINTANIIKESDRNEVMRSFIEPLKNVRQMGDDTPINFSQIARPAGTSDKNVKTVYINGVKERWQFSNDVIDAFSSLDGMSKDGIVAKIAQMPAQLMRFTVTNFPIFAARNVTRDTVSRVVMSRTGSGFKELIHNAKDSELFSLYGGAMAGYYGNGKQAYIKHLNESIKKISKNKISIVINPTNIAATYRDFLQKSENLNRIAEYKSAYNKAIKEGMDEYNAGLYAAFEARDLMDFAVSGTVIRELNKYIPFLNAGVQGMVRVKKQITEKPITWAVKTAMYTVLPTLLMRALVHAMGDDDEYEELPDYQRDLFWNYKLPGSNVWLSIPKPYENGVVSALVDRAISKAMGNDAAFDGLTGSVLKTLIPIDESSFLGSMKPIVENLTNYDFFRDKSIVNQWDEGKLRELRNGDKTASRISQTTTDLLYKAGYDVNPHKLDHLIKGYGTYMGDMALRIGDVGVKDSRFGFGISQLGFAKESPLSNSKTVKKVYDLAESIGYSQKTSIRRLRKMVESYYDAETVEDQKRITREVYAEAKSILPRLEERAKKEKEKATKL